MAEPLFAIRDELPQLAQRIYFDHGRSSPVPASVKAAQIKGIEFEQSYGIDPDSRSAWAQVRDATRQAAANLIGAKADNIAFVSSTSSALSIVSLAFPWMDGDNIVVFSVDNPANIVPWQNLRHRGVEVRYLPAGKDDLALIDSLPNLIDRRTRVVSLSLVQYATGERLDLQRVAELCHRRNAYLCVDAVQAVGALCVDVKALGAGFFAFGAQKWLIGPRNIAVLYADDTVCDLVRSPIVTEHNIENIQTEEELPTTGVPMLSIHPGALKLEAVPYNNFSGIFGLTRALANVEAAGMSAIETRIWELTSALVDCIKNINARVVSPRDDGHWSGIVSIDVPGADSTGLANWLRGEGVHVSGRKGRLRVCLHYYNTVEEIEEFVALLSRASRAVHAMRS